MLHCLPLYSIDFCTHMAYFKLLFKAYYPRPDLQCFGRLNKRSLYSVKVLARKWWIFARSSLTQRKTTGSLLFPLLKMHVQIVSSIWFLLVFQI